MKKKTPILSTLTLSASIFASVTSHAAVFYANNFSSLGTFSRISAFTINSNDFNTDPTLNVSCTGSSGTCTGVRAKRDGTAGACSSNADCIAVFTFSNFTLSNDVATSGSLPIAILSQSDITLSGVDFVLNGQNGAGTTGASGGPGGSSGGNSGSGGSGTGGGGAGTSPSGGGGAGFGGSGGMGQTSNIGGTGGSGGISYGTSSFFNSNLDGGSGGGSGNLRGGGGGGGSLELGALGKIQITNSRIDSFGGTGTAGSSGNTAAGGGGSGGTIFIHANEVELLTSPNLRVQGGNGGNADIFDPNRGHGGSGGGGRIHVAAASSLTGILAATDCTTNASTTASPGTTSGNGGLGLEGSCLVEINSLAIPEPSTYALFFALATLGFVFYRRHRA